MDMRPVGFFDSGLGGLTAARAFRELLPEENIVYLADTANCPFGVKDVSDIRTITKSNLDFLKGKGVKTIVAACGTASTVANDIINGYEIKTVNVFNPSVRKMAEIKGDGALAVLATDASIKSGRFQEAIEKASGKKVYGVACQGFVTLCESGHTDPEDAELKKAVEEYLTPIKGKVDAVLLGCTHFGLVEEAISEFLPGVEIVSASKAAAEEMADYLVDNSMTGGEGREEIICSGYEICSEM